MKNTTITILFFLFFNSSFGQDTTLTGAKFIVADRGFTSVIKFYGKNETDTIPVIIFYADTSAIEIYTSPTGMSEEYNINYWPDHIVKWMKGFVVRYNYYDYYRPPQYLDENKQPLSKNIIPIN